MNPEIEARASYWANSPAFDSKTRAEIQELIAAGNTEDLTNRFFQDLQFGTAGLRGIMGAGSAYMNIYNVRRATYAVARHVLSQWQKDHPPPKIALSYDCRKGSEQFANAAAEVLAAQNIKVLFTKSLGPVPWLSFLVREWHCQAGIYITASHNPPEYNGFKVYLETGGQIIPPQDAAVAEYYRKSDRYEDIPTLALKTAEENRLIEWIGQELSERYDNKLKEVSLFDGRDINIVYTPLHGTAGVAVPPLLAKQGFEQVLVVAEQAQPNGNFPTVCSPNPGEPDSLSLAAKKALDTNADLVLANDPDCDRLAMMARNRSTLEFVDGNEMGALLIDFILKKRKEQNALHDGFIVKTIVTSELHRRIADHYGVSTEETLTGFKWIAERIEKYESGALSPYRKYICGGEEAFGFLIDTFVRDKDAISASFVAAQMAAYHKQEGKTLFDAIRDLYRAHGCYGHLLHTEKYEGQSGIKTIENLMEKFRSTPPDYVQGKALTSTRDVLTGEEFDITRDRKTPSTLPKSNVLQWFFGDSLQISIRPSGTEPLLKFYITGRIETDPNMSDEDIDTNTELARKLCSESLHEILGRA